MDRHDLASVVTLTRVYHVTHIWDVAEDDGGARTLSQFQASVSSTNNTTNQCHRLLSASPREAPEPSHEVHALDIQHTYLAQPGRRWSDLLSMSPSFINPYPPQWTGSPLRAHFGRNQHGHPQASPNFEEQFMRPFGKFAKSVLRKCQEPFHLTDKLMYKAQLATFRNNVGSRTLTFVECPPKAKDLFPTSILSPISSL